MSPVKDVAKDLAKVALDSVEIKIDFKKLFNGVVDHVVEKAIDEIVAGTETKFDDSAKAMLWPILEPKIKDLLDKYAENIQSAMDKKLQEIKDSVLPPTV